MAQKTFIENENIEPNLIDEDDVDADESKIISITSLNDYCLAKIFSYLTLNDLLNVALSNKWLMKGAQLAYKGLKQTKVELNVFLTFRRTNDIKHRKYCFRILRCFGYLITSLKINYTCFSENLCNQLDRYIAEYCGASLVEINILWGREYTLKDLDKSFANVERVYIHGIHMLDQLLCLKSWFPNMDCLDLDTCFNPNQEILWPHYFKGVIRMNQQLRHLNVYNSWNYKVLKSISKLPDLETLGINRINYDIKQFDREIIRMKKVKIFNYNQGLLEAQFTTIPTIEFDQLEELSLPTQDFLNNTTFFQQHSGIKKLTIGKTIYTKLDDLSAEVLQKMSNDFPSLTELNLNFSTTVRGAVLITQILKTFKSLFFQLGYPRINNMTEPEVINLFVGLHSKWNVSIVDSWFGYIKLYQIESTQFDAN